LIVGRADRLWPPAGVPQAKRASATRAPPAPLSPTAEPLRAQRKVSGRGQVVIAGQKIQVGIGHAGTIVTIEDTDGTFHASLGDQSITEVARTTTKPIARFKARKPEPSRPSTSRLRECDSDGRTMLV
jgi:hypothetical protein